MSPQILALLHSCRRRSRNDSKLFVNWIIVLEFQRVGGFDHIDVGLTVIDYN